jgi:hypothetical protein
MHDRLRRGGGLDRDQVQGRSLVGGAFETGAAEAAAALAAVLLMEGNAETLAQPGHACLVHDDAALGPTGCGFRSEEGTDDALQMPQDGVEVDEASGLIATLPFERPT